MRAHNPQTKADVIALVCAVGIRRAARLSNVPRTTVQRWAHAAAVKRARRQFGDLDAALLMPDFDLSALIGDDTIAALLDACVLPEMPESCVS